jgi:hypothetical protein
LQRTEDDLEGLTTTNVKDKAIWTVCDGAQVGTTKTPNLSARFLVGAAEFTQLEIDGDVEGRTNKKPEDTGGNERIVLTVPQGAMTNHSHYLGSYGKEAAAGNGDLNIRKTAPVPLQAESGFKIQTVDAGDQVKTPTHTNCRTMGVYAADEVPGSPPDVEPDEDRDYSIQPHDNLPPFYVVVFIMRTNRVDSASPTA